MIYAALIWLYCIGALLSYNTFEPVWRQRSMDPTNRHPWASDIIFQFVIWGWPVAVPLIITIQLYKRSRPGAHH